MPQISKEELLRVAEIARLKLDERELASLEKDANEIMEYLGKVREIQGETELYYLNGTENPLREDAAKECGKAAEIRKQFTHAEEDFLVAPKSL